jgi:signal-transduction protein with cAMP-binding, CBS, and nucleotidyltransferase domain
MADGFSAPPDLHDMPASPRASALLAWLTHRVADAMRPDPSVVPAATPLLAAVGVLRRSEAPACLVTDAAGRAVGLLDADLLLREAIFQVDPATPVERIMDGAASLVGGADLLHEAAARLVRERRRALGVVDREGRPLGLLTTETTLAPLLEPFGSFLGHAGLPGWTERAALWSALLQDGQDASAVQSAMSALNDALFARVTETCVQAMAEDGWGEPPVRFTVLLMGSGGRHESFLRPDQDNGFILDDYPDGQHDQVDRWFIELAGRFTRALDGAGFPLCRGHVMATNPVWRKSISQWRAQIAGWAHRRSLQSVMWADIFLDFRAVGRAAGMGDELRAAVLQVCAEQPLYLKQLSWEHVRQDVPLGLFGQLLGEPVVEHHHEIDLKLRATLPLAGLIRMLALRAGIAETGTMDRLRALITAGRISGGFGALLAEDFAILTGLRVRQQIADLEAGRPVGNHLKLAGLTERERKRLVRLFRSVDTLRRVAAQEFGGRLG